MRSHVESLAGPSRSIIKPPELDSAEGGVIWSALTASDDGDVAALRELLRRDPRLSRAEYWYTPAIHFAVREGHTEAMQQLLDAGADPEWNGLHDGSLITMARDRGHAGIARLLEEARDRRGRVLAGGMLRTLLAHGMSPDLMNWQHQTLLHLVCEGRDYRGRDKTDGAVERATILLDAGADISPRDDEYRSTPLAWAARTNALPVAAFLLAHNAPTNLPDDEPWATPLAWAERRGHTEMSALLRRHGAGR